VLRRGMQMITTAPPSGVEPSVISPWWLSTSALAIARPKPLPPVSRLLERRQSMRHSANPSQGPHGRRNSPKSLQLPQTVSGFHKTSLRLDQSYDGGISAKNCSAFFTSMVPIPSSNRSSRGFRSWRASSNLPRAAITPAKSVAVRSSHPRAP
jgi:hypothetical protein